MQRMSPSRSGLPNSWALGGEHEGGAARGHIGGDVTVELVRLVEEIRAAGSVGQGVGDRLDGGGKCAAGESFERTACGLVYCGHHCGRIDEALDIRGSAPA